MQKIFQKDIKKINYSKFPSRVTIKENSSKSSVLGGMKLRNYISQKAFGGKTFSQIKNIVMEKCQSGVDKEKGKKILKVIEVEYKKKN